MATSLFDDDDDGPEATTDATFGLNKDYAARFELRKKKQELARLQQLHGDDVEDSEDAESEDENAELLTPDLDLQIFKTIDKIRARDSGVYDPNKKWFEDVPEGVPESSGSGSSQAKPKGKVKAAKVTLKTQLLEHGAAALASDDEDEDVEEGGGGGKLAYDPEQEKLRRNLMEAGSGEAEAEDVGEAGLLQKKPPSEQQQVEELEYKDWLRKKLEEQPKAGRVDESVTLRRYMFGDGSQLSSDERFLRDYVLNARWKKGDAGDEEEDGDGDGDGDAGQAAAGSERAGTGEDDDGEFSDRADDYERAHNFRFEEAGATQVVSHVRHDPKSMRRQSKLARKNEQAEQKKERQLELRKQKEAELRRLKNLKKAEILERLQTIQGISGGAMPLSEVDLSGDFDPEAFDKRMAEVYNDDYYAQADDSFHAEEVPQGLWDGEEAPSSEAPRGGFEALTKKLQQSKNKKVRRTAQQYMDEYYALDFEDVIGNDLPTRFKYRSVAASGFGITDADMLELSDKELNQRVPLRFVKSPYAEHDETRLKKRQKRMHWETLKDAKDAQGRQERQQKHAKKASAKWAPSKAKAGGAAAKSSTADAAAKPRPVKRNLSTTGDEAAPPKSKSAAPAAASDGLSKKARKAGISGDRAHAFLHLKQKGGVKKRQKDKLERE